MCAQLTIIRHGESEWNVAKRWIGQQDSKLTSKGVDQIRRLAGRLASQHVTSIYSSDLGRARASAELIASACAAPIFMDARLRERHLGVLQGLTVEEAGSIHPAAVRQFRDTYEGPTHGVETLADVGSRSMDAVNEISGRHPEENVVIVTHHAVIESVFRSILDVTKSREWRIAVPHAALNIWRHSGRGWKLVVWGDVSHL